MQRRRRVNLRKSASTTPAPAEPETGLHQNIARACSALAALADSSEQGMRFADIERAMGLSKATMHRLLLGLVDKGLADFDETSGRYFLGMRLFMWSAAAGDRFAVLRNIGSALDGLAHETEDTVYLMIRNGFDAICLARKEGRFRSGPSSQGRRSASAWNRRCEFGAARIHARGRHRAGLAGWRARTRAIRHSRSPIAQDDGERTSAALRAWYSGQIIPNMSAIGLPLFDVSGNPIASLSVAALSDRLAPARRAEIAALLQREAAASTKRLKRASA